MPRHAGVMVQRVIVSIPPVGTPIRSQPADTIFACAVARRGRACCRSVRIGVSKHEGIAPAFSSVDCGYFCPVRPTTWKTCRSLISCISNLLSGGPAGLQDRITTRITTQESPPESTPNFNWYIAQAEIQVGMDAE